MAGKPPASDYPARWWTMLPDGRMECRLCPRFCKLQEGQRGFCFVRQRTGGGMVLTTYGRSSGFCVDPIEKKPLNHFLPGTSVLSFGTAGCNLGCRFCQNWDISKAREFDRLSDAASPDAIAASAKRLGCHSVAFTYNDPVIFAEYAIEVAQACRAQGIKTVAVTAGYITDEARPEFYRAMDAANVDLKAFTEDFYHRLCYAQLQPVLDTLVYLRRETDVWFEVTTPADSGGERQPRGTRPGLRLVCRQPRAGCAVAFHRVSSRLQDARQAPDAARHPRAGAGDRTRQGAEIRVHRQRPRPHGREHVVPGLRRAAHRTRLV